MDEGIKRKLVGTAVLVVVAIVVLPMITPRTQNAAYLSDSVPLESDVPDMLMPLPKSLSIATRTLVDSGPQTLINMKEADIDGDRLASANIAVPITDNSGQAKVWHIQVASFAEPSNAIALRNKLRDAGYKAFDRPSEDGKYIRVFVGPSTQMSSLEQKIAQINKTFKIKGELVPYLGK